MKGIKLSDKDRRTVTIAGVLLVAVVGYLKGVKPYATAYADASSQLSTTRDSLTREQIEVRAAQQNPQRQHHLDSAMDVMGKRLFVGKDSVAASDDLEQYIRLLAREAHVHVTQSRTEGTTTLATGVRTLRLGFTAQSDLQGIIAFLDSLDHGDHLVCVEKMTMAILTSVDTSKGVQEIQIQATADGYQVPSNLAVTTAKAGIGAAAATPAAGGFSSVSSGAGAGAGRATGTSSLPCDPSPPPAGTFTATKKAGQ
jgi:hypothetical protein